MQRNTQQHAQITIPHIKTTTPPLTTRGLFTSTNHSSYSHPPTNDQGLTLDEARGQRAAGEGEAGGHDEAVSRVSSQQEAQQHGQYNTNQQEQVGAIH